MNKKITINNELSLIIPKRKDAKEIYRLIENNRMYLSEWLHWAHECTPRDVKNNIKDRVRGFKNQTSASFFGAYNGTIVASVGLVSIDTTNRKGELGYWLDRAHSGKGFMQAYLQRCVEYGFVELSLNKIVINVATGNIKSIAVAQRLGFQREATLKDHLFQNERFYDIHIFVMFRDEWVKNNINN